MSKRAFDKEHLINAEQIKEDLARLVVHEGTHLDYELEQHDDPTRGGAA